MRVGIVAASAAVKKATLACRCAAVAEQKIAGQMHPGRIRMRRFLYSSGTHSGSGSGSGSHSTKTAARSSSSSKKHSTTSAMDLTHSFPSVLLHESGSSSISAAAAAASPTTAARPSTAALRTLFVVSAVPMVGFGAMDNFVMIQAGQYIDSTLGVQLGLATMTAAAAGQVVSDVSGVVFGGTLERMLMKMSLIQAPALTTQQRQLPIARNVAMAGAVVGVIIGCALGATTLLWVDLDARDRIQRAGQLRAIVNDMIAHPQNQQQQQQHETDHHDMTTAGGFRTPCSSCTVYIADTSHNTVTLTDDNSSNARTTTRLKLMKEADSPSVRQSAENGTFVLSPDRNVLHVPVMKRKSNGSSSGAKETMAVVALHAANHQGFVDDDVVAAQIMARHIAIFMDRLSD